MLRICKLTVWLAAMLACLSLNNIAIAQVVDPCGYGCPKEGCPKCDKGGGPIGAEADTEESAAASEPADAAAEEEAAEEDSAPRRGFGY